MGRRARKKGLAPPAHDRRQVANRGITHVRPLVIWGLDGTGTHGVGLAPTGDGVGIGITERSPDGKQIGEGIGGMFSVRDTRTVIDLLTVLCDRVERGENTEWTEEDLERARRDDNA